MGNLLCITDAAGNRVHYSYNKRDELTGILQMEKGKEAAFLPVWETGENTLLRDEDWEKIRKHNEENKDLHLTVFDRDKAGQVIKVTDALNGEDHYSYDCMGKIIKRLDQNGGETFFTYHADGELKSITYPEGSTALHRMAEYQYDGLKRLNRIKDWLGETILHYDKEGNLTESSMLLTGEKEKQTIVYEYTLSGKRKSITYPDGSRSEYAYDDNGRITELIHQDQEGILEKFNCEYDSSGNRTYLKRESRDPAFSFEKTYGYDLLDRLINISEDGTLRSSFMYDGYGNRINEKRYLNGEIISEKECAYNALNQLILDEENRYLYDKKGNCLQYAASGNDSVKHTMRYDPNNFLTELYENAKLMQQNDYNGAGIRVRSRDTYGESVYGTDYADPLRKIITEVKGKSTFTDFVTEEPDRDIQNRQYRNYLWQGSTLLGMPQEGLHVLTDLCYSPIRITDREGNTENLYGYDEYGMMEKQKESVSMPFGYAGYVKESIPGLYYTGSRAYTVKEGRFLSKDLYKYLDVKDPLSINLYAYVKNNPLRYIDPDGHTCIEEKSYLARSIEMVVLGEFSDEVTGLGLGASVLLGVLGWDVLLDARDFVGSLAKFAPKDLSCWGNVGLNLVALIPFIGVLKPVIKGFKHLDEVAGVVKYSDEVAGSAKYLDEGADAGKHLDEVVETVEAARKAQKAIIESVENSAEGTKGLTSLQKGNYGEMKMDNFFESQNIVRKTLAGARGSVYYIFQGGEPTLRGIGFFEKFIEYEKQYNKNRVPVFRSIQTNGSCIDEQWCSFLAENGFLVGLSVDGTRQTHDLHRHDRNGGNTFGSVLQAAKLFDRYGVEYNILTVVTEAVAENVESIYEFYKKMGWKYQQYIACMEPAGANDADTCVLSASLYGEFLIRLFRCWYLDWEKGEQIYIRQFENYVQKLMGMMPEACAHAGVCSRQYAVEADGSVYPCDFYMLDEYCLGNFSYSRLPVLEEKRKEILFLEESAKISETCVNCQYFSLCRNGCQRNRRREEETDTYINRFCRGFRMFFDNCMEDMIKISEKLQKSSAL